MKFDKMIKILFILFCLLFIIIPLIKTDYIGGKKSSTENRHLAVGLGALFDDKKDNFNITKWISDNIGFRDYMINIKSYLNYNIMNISPTKLVVIGKEGWLFYTGDNNLEIASGKYPLDNKTLENISVSMYKCQQNLERYGIKFITTIGPSKATIYPEFIKGINKITDITPIDIVRDKINSSIHFIDIKKDIIMYKKANPENLLYWKGDTHWTQLSGYIGYLAILNKINNLYKNENITIHPAQVVYKNMSKNSGDLVHMFGKVKPKNIEYNYYIPTVVGKTYKQDESKKNDLIRFVKNKKFLQYYINEKAGNRQTLLIFGDSFLEAMLPFISQSFYKTVFFRYYINNDIIDIVQPDIVLILNTERSTSSSYLTSLAKCAELK